MPVDRSQLMERMWLSNEHKAPVSAMALNAPMLVTGDSAGIVIQWDTFGGCPMRRIAACDRTPAAGLPITCVRVSDEFCMNASRDGSIEV